MKRRLHRSSGRPPFGSLVLASIAASLAGVASAQPAGPISVGPEDVTLVWRGDEVGTGRATLRRSDEEPSTARTIEDSVAGTFHLVEVDGLEPDTEYSYSLEPGGAEGLFRTLRRPPGPITGVVFLLSDVHMCVPGRHDDSASDDRGCGSGVRRLGSSREAYAEALADIRRRHGILRGATGEELPAIVVIAGDLQQWPGEGERAALVELSVEGLQICPIPGNHEKWDSEWRAHFEQLIRDLPPSSCRYDGARATVELGRWRVVLLDSATSGSPAGRIGDEQLRWLDERLAEAPDSPTILTMHHPLVPHPLSAILNADAAWLRIEDGQALAELLDRHPQVVAACAGHLHVNWTGRRGGITQFILSALVQYPMGYHSLTLYEGGLVRRFYAVRANAAEAEASSTEVSAWAREEGLPFSSVAPGLVLGTLADRSSVLLLPESAPDVADAGTGTDGAPADGEPPAVGGDAEVPRPDEVPSEAASSEAVRPGMPPAAAARPRGCRCDAAGARGGTAAWPALVAWLAWILGRRRVSRSGEARRARE